MTPPSESDRSDDPDRSDGPDRSDDPGRPADTDRPDDPDRSDGPDRSDDSGRPADTDRSDDPDPDPESGTTAIGRYLRAVWAIVRKDFVLEIRSKQAVPLSVTLSLLIVVVFAFSFPGARDGRGALWTAFIFAGMLGVMQSITVETETRALDGLLLTPIAPSAIYVGKVISNTLVVSLVGVTTLLAVTVFLQAPLPLASIPTAVAVIVLFSVGFAAASVVVAIITSLTSISALLLPVLLVPILIPALLAGIQQFETGRALWFFVLSSYDAVVFAAGVLLFRELVR